MRFMADGEVMKPLPWLVPVLHCVSTGLEGTSFYPTLGSDDSPSIQLAVVTKGRSPASRLCSI